MTETFPSIYRRKGSLHISEFASRIASALQELFGERVTELLPTLQTLFLEEPLRRGPVHEAIERFVAARQLESLASLPIAVSRWKREEERVFI
jgi:hypothetical protein